MKNLYTFLFAFVISITGFSQNYQFGIVQNTGYNFSIVAVPSFDAANTDISDIGFALMLPAGDADIINVSQFDGRNWTTNQVTAAQLTGAGLGDGSRDAFVMNLPPGQSLLSHTTDTPFVLMTFDISNSPTSGLLEILTNSDPIAMGLGGAVDSFYNSNIDATTTQDYFGGVVPGQDNFMLETLGVHDIELESYTISVYPNPSSDILKVSTNLDVQKMTLYNILGKLMITVEETRSITVNKLSAGNYILKIQTNKGTIMKKVIIE